MQLKKHIPSKKEIESAHQRIKNYIHRTPILTSSSINKMFSTKLFFKCENFQKAGAFKMRGATNAALLLSKVDLEKGLATHSSGNHAGALSLAAKLLNTSAYIAMPSTAPDIKRKAVEGYGAKITFCKPTLEDREKTLNKIVRLTGATFIHPYDDYRIIAGQATCAKEIFEEVSNIDFLLAPLGGGGLLSGSALSAKYFNNATRVIGVEPKEADDAYRSIRDGKIYPSVNPKTIADGLLTSLSKKTFNIISENVSEIITVKEETILSAMYLIWERMKIVIEPSSATVLAAIMENQSKFENASVALILSGGNVSLKKAQG
ncbi:MAG: pyridoxal-phosphate dependent enzyme [Bacteroidota bacterium]